MPHSRLSGASVANFTLIRIARCIENHRTGQDGSCSTGMYEFQINAIINYHLRGGSLRHLQGLRVAEHLSIYPVHFFSLRLKGIPPPPANFLFN